MTTLLASLHASPGSGHPGSQRTLSLLQARYWWPSMAWDVSQYVRGCSVCAISETPHHLPTRKLVPLPIPCRPWSHVGVDFVTDLPKSEGYTCILVATVSTNNTHQIPIPWLLITATCQRSSTALYPCTPPVHSLSGLKTSMLTYLIHWHFVYLPVAPVFISLFSTASVLHRLQEKDIITQSP